MQNIYEQFEDFKTVEISFVNEENELHKISSSIMNIDGNKILIDTNNTKNKEIFMNLGQKVQIYIYTDNGIYSGKSQILRITKNAINTEYTLSIPTDSKHSQRRAHFRANLHINFKLYVMPSENYQTAYTIESTTRDICANGLSYLSEKPFLEDSILRLELFFDNEIIKMNAKLVYTRETIIDGKKIFINAFTFTDIIKRNTEFITKKCFLHQLQLRKK